MAEFALRVDDLEVRYEAIVALNGVTFAVQRGDMVAVIGPNGSGKSTLLKSLDGLVRPHRGAVAVYGDDLTRLRPRELARRVAVVPQTSAVEFDFTVEEVVMMGRTPHLGRLSWERSIDRQAVDEALRLASAEDLRKRSIRALSGGERQRVVLARALAQQPEILLLDEPTSHLDIALQVEILNSVRKLNRERRITVLAVIHDLNLAARFFDKFILLAQGQILASGVVDEVLTTENIRRAYQADVLIQAHPIDGRPLVIPLIPAAFAADVSANTV